MKTNRTIRWTYIGLAAVTILTLSITVQARSSRSSDRAPAARSPQSAPQTQPTAPVPSPMPSPQRSAERPSRAPQPFVAPPAPRPTPAPTTIERASRQPSAASPAAASSASGAAAMQRRSMDRSIERSVERTAERAAAPRTAAVSSAEARPAPAPRTVEIKPSAPTGRSNTGRTTTIQTPSTRTIQPSAVTDAQPVQRRTVTRDRATTVIRAERPDTTGTPSDRKPAAAVAPDGARQTFGRSQNEHRTPRTPESVTQRVGRFAPDTTATAQPKSTAAVTAGGGNSTRTGTNEGFRVYGSAHRGDRGAKPDTSAAGGVSTLSSDLRDKTVQPVRGRTHSDRVREMTQPRAAAGSVITADAAVSSGRHGGGLTQRVHSARDRSSQVVINNNTNIIVQGNVTRHHPRPYIPPRYVTNITYIRSSPLWVPCGSSFVFHWSSLSCGRVAVVPFSSYYGVTYYYPSYHRKYVFVSLGGCWPSYRYVRYYWYGVHPYDWYGAYAIPAEPVVYNTYNTYNTYTTTPAPAAPATGTSGSYQYNPATDDFSDVRKRLEAEKNAVDAPEFETAADLTFAHAVKLFEAGNFADAAKQFREAMTLSPDDVVLPFTYAQALFADGRYELAAQAVRDAMANVPAEEPTVYYPRGLYEKEDTLTAQIATLEKVVADYPFNTDYRLLLGYHYLGIGQLDKAKVSLSAAKDSAVNADAVEKMLGLIEQLATEKKGAVTL